jgi:hypothetical protein
MGRRLKLIVLGLFCAFIGYLVGRSSTLSDNSMVLSVVRRPVEASTGPFICTLGQMGDVRRYLSLAGIQTDKFDNLRTIDDENMLVVFDGREVTAVEFTTFKYQLPEEKCSRIGN